MGAKIVGMYDPIPLVVLDGDSYSQRLVIGRNSIVGFFIENYAGGVYINVSDSLTSTDDPNKRLTPGTVIENTFDINYAYSQVPRDELGTRYQETSGTTNRVYVPVDFSIFMGTPCVEFELAAGANAGDVQITVVLWEVK